MARSSTTSDVFNAVAEGHRREILDALIAGEKAVGAIVDDLSLSQPQVSKHLRVLEHAGLVSRSRDAQYRPALLDARPLRDAAAWIGDYRQFWTASFDSLDDHLTSLERKEPQ